MQRARRGTAAAVIFAVCLAALPVRAGDTDATSDELARKIRPILARCVKCHSGDMPAGELDLSTRDGARAGGESGEVALRPGDAAASRLYQMAAMRKMPPKKPLPPEQIALVRAWIDAGAPWSGTIRKGEAPSAEDASARWALGPLTRPIVPAVKDHAWLASPIDAFILERLEASGLAPAPAADRATLIRRATFDLLGILPTPDEVDAFAADKSPRAFDALVDRLLASPRYGERWGRHWLDVARFSESHGFEFDRIREHAWRYRDYVIQSFNADKPYFAFVREQLAGDTLDPVTSEGIVATGFLVMGPWDEANQIQKSSIMRARAREEELEDMVAAVSQTFLGMTVNCARCHDHKFDPIPQRDYYRLKAALEGVQHGNRPILPPGELTALEGRRAEVARQVAALEKRAAVIARPGREEELGTSLTDQERAQLDALRVDLEDRRAALAAVPHAPQSYAANPSDPPPTFVLERGDVAKAKERVAAGGLSAVTSPSPELGLPVDAPEGRRRLSLADWIADPENPLTARVLVNRVWHYHFGAGLVATPNDFGANGDRPSHPALLDWLANDFVASGGRLKALHRRIMLSSAYRQSSRHDARAAAADADGRLLWRFPPRRLEAEAIRDAMLAAGGQLSVRIGGPSFRPFTLTVFGSNLYTLTDPIGPEFDRRAVYRINVDSAKSPLLDALDCPDPSVKAPRRALTTTPLQALGLMNNTFVLRQAKHLAERCAREASGGVAGGVDRAYRLALGRRPTASDRERAAALAGDHGLEAVCWVLFNSSEFLYLR